LYCGFRQQKGAKGFMGLGRVKKIKEEAKTQAGNEPLTAKS
jgi:hypothetical protein